MNWVYKTLVYDHVKNLYLHAPAQFGGWSGQTPSQICAKLTNTEEIFWESNQRSCSLLIESKFYAIHETMQELLYFALLFYIFKFFCLFFAERFVRDAANLRLR